MHAREDQHGGPAAKRARPPVKAPARAAGLAPPGASVPTQLLTLQRLAGNQAVARAVAEDRHEHGAGCGHEVSSVQRSPKEQQAGQSSLLDALRSPGRPLEPHILQRAERGYNMSFDHVRQHDDPVAQRAAVEFGARAMTIGSDIIIGPQGASDETKYHELDHVHWNAQGRPVEGGDNGAGVKVSYTDAPSERQATTNGQRLARGDAPELGFPGAADAQASAAVQRTRGEEAAQRHVHEAGCGHGLPVQRNPARPTGSLDAFTRDPDQMMAPNAQDQAALESVFPQNNGVWEQFPDPVAPHRALTKGILDAIGKIKPAPWVGAINPRRDEGGSKGPYRRNCIDAVRSFLASWSGNPTVAAGVKKEGLEVRGNQETANWLNAGFREPANYRLSEGSGQVGDDWDRVEQMVAQGPHGTSCVVVFLPDGKTENHAIAIVKHKNDVVWVDPQRGKVSKNKRLYEGSSLMTIVLDPGFVQVQPPQLPGQLAEWPT